MLHSSDQCPVPIVKLPFYRTLYARVLVGIVASVLVDFSFPTFAQFMKPFRDGFIKLTRKMIAPIMFLSVVVGIANIRDTRKLGRVGIKALFYFEVVTTLALGIGLGVATLFRRMLDCEGWTDNETKAIVGAIEPAQPKNLRDFATAMANRHGSIAAAVLIMFAASAIIRAQTPEPQQELRGSIRIVGTDTMKELMDRWIAGFTAIHPGVRIELIAKGALTAAPALSNGSADLAMLGREFTPSEIVGFHAKRHYDPTGIRVAIGSYDISGKTVALAFFVNQSNPITKLNFQQLDAIYCNSLRRKAPYPITKWGQLGLTGEWAIRDIHLVGVNFPDGISNFIRLRVCKGGDLRQGIREEHTGGPINVLDRIVTDVAVDPASIGYAGFANLKPGSKLIAVSEDGGPYLEGTRAEVETARYPLSRYIYIFIDRAPGRQIEPLKLAFLRYVTGSAGQALAGSDGIYMPLPLSIAANQLEELR